MSLENYPTFIQPSQENSLIDYAVQLFDGRILIPSEYQRPIQEPLFVYPDRQCSGFFTHLTKRTKEDRMRSESYSIRMIADIIRFCDRGINNYISQHSFNARDRKLAHLQSFNTVWVDLDYYRNPEFACFLPETVQERILERCQEVNFPLPSLILFSGRGIHCKWLLDRPLPAVALSKWNLVQRTLVEKFRDFRSDSMCGATQPLRIEQTVNTKSKEIARILWEQREQGANEPIRYDFNFLSDRILPLTEEQYKASLIRTKAPQKRKTTNTAVHRTRFTWETFYWGRFQDVRKLTQLRGYDSGLPDGLRYPFMFAAANSLCWFVRADHLYGELLALGKEFAPHWSPRKVMEHCRFIFKKFNSMTAKGEHVGRLLIKNETVIDRLEITPSEQREMSILISPWEKQRRHRERMQTLRRASGMLTREDYEAQRLIETQKRRLRAIELREKGLNYREIASEMEMTGAGVFKLLNSC